MGIRSLIHYHQEQQLASLNDELHRAALAAYYECREAGCISLPGTAGGWYTFDGGCPLSYLDAKAKAKAAAAGFSGRPKIFHLEWREIFHMAPEAVEARLAGLPRPLRLSLTTMGGYPQWVS